MALILPHSNVRIVQLLVISLVVLILFLAFGRIGSRSVKNRWYPHHAKVAETLSYALPSFKGDVPKPRSANATLDFQEIIYLSMPYRTDRQDALSLIAAVTDLKLHMFPGVKADEIHPKAMPPSYGTNNMTGTPPLGIWRAHANIWRYIIDNNIQSALVIEDDVDWDLNIKEVMGMLSWQLRYNNTIRWGKDNVQKGWKEDCPYGCDWDELFVGHCGGRPNPNRLDLHQVYNEPHSPPHSVLQDWVSREMTQTWNLTESEGIRVLAPTYEPICLQAYGISRMGAMRMLYQIGGWRPFDYPVDNELAWRTRDGFLSGYTMMPPAFSVWRIGGSQDSDNDAGMNGQEVQTEGNMGGKSENLKNSVRRHLQEYFKKNYWESMANEIR